VGIDFFKKVLFFQNKYNKKKLIIKNNIQTNGTLLSKEFRDFFEDNDFVIGTSIQGTKKIHDSMRIDHSGNPTYEKIIKNISKLKNKPSAIIVLTKESLGKEEKIYKEIKPYVKGLRISEYFPGGLNPKKDKTDNNQLETIMPTPEEYGNSMIKFYNLWKKDKNPIEIRPITEFIRGFIQGECSGCLYSQKACNFSVIGIKSNGDFFTCMRGAQNKEFFLGNIKEQPLKKHKKFARRFMDQRIKILSTKECENCKFWNQCNGGCPQESLMIYGDLNHKSFYCEGRKMLFEKILGDIEQK
jgi:uncharacterized protein